jgi:hypothetical protein
MNCPAKLLVLSGELALPTLRVARVSRLIGNFDTTAKGHGWQEEGVEEGNRRGTGAGNCPETRNATPRSGVSDLCDRSAGPVTGPLKGVAEAFCPWPSAGFPGWLFPFQGRSLAIALAGPALLNAGWDEPVQRYITGAIDIAIGLPFDFVIIFNKIAEDTKRIISQ